MTTWHITSNSGNDGITDIVPNAFDGISSVGDNIIVLEKLALTAHYTTDPRNTWTQVALPENVSNVTGTPAITAPDNWYALVGVLGLCLCFRKDFSGYSGAADLSHVWYTRDGVSWTCEAFLPKMSGPIYSGADNGDDVAVMPMAGSNKALKLDSTGFSEITLPSLRDWRFISYGGGLFIVLANDAAVCAVSSDDGATWTEHALPELISFRGIVYAGGWFIAGGRSSNTILYTQNGSSWNTGNTSSPEYDCYCLSTDGTYAVWMHSLYGIKVSIELDENDDPYLSAETYRIPSYDSGPVAWDSSVYANGWHVVVPSSTYGKCIYTQDGVYWVRSTGDGSEDLPWIGYDNIQVSAIKPGDTIYLRGEFYGMKWELPFQGKKDEWITIRGDYSGEPGSITTGKIYSIISTDPDSGADIIGPDGNGEYYFSANIGSGHNMWVTEDRIRMDQVNQFSVQRPLVTLFSASNNTVTVSERANRYYSNGDSVIFDGPTAGKTIIANVGLSVHVKYFIVRTGTDGTYKIAATYADATASTPVTLDILVDASATGSGLWGYFVRTDTLSTDFYPPDLEVGSLLPGQCAVDLTQAVASTGYGRVYFKPSSGTAADHEYIYTNNSFIPAIWTKAKNYIRFVNLEMHSCGKPLYINRQETSLDTHHSQFFQLIGCKIYACLSGPFLEDVSNVLIQSNEIYDCGERGVGGAKIETLEQRNNGIETDWIVEYNHIHDIGGKHVYINCQGLIANPGCHRWKVRFNLFENASGYLAASENCAFVMDSSIDQRVYGNVFLKNAVCIDMAGGPDGAIEDNYIGHNVFLLTGYDADSYAPYNIDTTRDIDFAVGNCDGLVIEHNLFSGGNYTQPDASNNIWPAAIGLRCNGYPITNTKIRNNTFNAISAGYAIAYQALSTSVLPDIESSNNHFREAGGIHKDDHGSITIWDEDHIVGTTSGNWTFDEQSDTGSTTGTAYAVPASMNFAFRGKKSIA